MHCRKRGSASASWRSTFCPIRRFFLRFLAPMRQDSLACRFFCALSPQWSNALCEKRKRLDVLAVGAYDGETLIGLAGCSADCEEMWQIGIDVLPIISAPGALQARLPLKLRWKPFKEEKFPFTARHGRMCVLCAMR